MSPLLHAAPSSLNSTVDRFLIDFPKLIIDTENENGYKRHLSLVVWLPRFTDSEAQTQCFSSLC